MTGSRPSQLRAGALALGLLTALLLGSSGVPTPVAAQAAPSDLGSDVGLSPTGARTLAGLEACLRADPRLGVALVIDETLTLRRTDPDRVRADAIVQFVSRLRELTSVTDDDGVARELWLHVAFFGSGHDVWQDWRILHEDDDEFEDRLRAEIVRRDGARHTRFERAVAPTGQALSDLAVRVGGEGLCTFALWFSDGELDPDDRPSLGPDRPAMLEAIEELCRPDGVMDRFRAGGSTLVGLLLNVDVDPTSIASVGMREMVEGTGPRGGCGTLPAAGVFLEGDLDALLRSVERIVVGEPNLVPSGDPIRIEVEPGVDRLRLVGSAGDGIAIVTAAGRVLEAAPGQPGSGDLASRAQVRWAGRSVSIDVTVDGDHGTWTVRRAGVASSVDVFLFSDLTLTLDRERTLLLRGSPSTLAGRIVAPRGSAPDLDVFSDARIDAVVVGADADRIAAIAQDGAFTVPVRLDGPAAGLDVTMALRLVTAGGATLQPVVLRAAVGVTLPEEFPTATLREARYLPTVQRTGDVATLAVDLTGSRLGPTRVCPRAAGTDPAIAVTVRDLPPGDCIDLATGATETVLVEARLVRPSLDARELSAPVTLRLVSAERTDQPALELETVLAAAVPVGRTPPSPLAFFALLAIALLVPWVVLWWLTDRAAVLRARRSLRVAHVDALLVPEWDAQRPADDDGQRAPDRLRLGRRSEDGAMTTGGPVVLADDFIYPAGTPFPKGTRTWTVAGTRSDRPIRPLGETVRAVRPGPRLRRPAAEVVAPPGMRIVTTVAAGFRGGTFDRARGRLVLDGVGHLLFRDADLRGPVHAPVPVRLTLFEDASGRTLQDRLAPLNDRLARMVTPALLARLRDVARADGPPASPPGSGGGSAGGVPGWSPPGSGGGSAGGVPRWSPPGSDGGVPPWSPPASE